MQNLYLASMLSSASTKKWNCLKNEMGKSLIFIWWASMLSPGLSFKILYFATIAFDMPLCCCLNRNCRFKLESWMRRRVLRLCPYPGCAPCRSVILTALSKFRIRFRQLPQSKFVSCSTRHCSCGWAGWFWSAGRSVSQSPYSKYWL